LGLPGKELSNKTAHFPENELSCFPGNRTPVDCPGFLLLSESFFNSGLYACVDKIRGGKFTLVEYFMVFPSDDKHSGEAEIGQSTDCLHLPDRKPPSHRRVGRWIIKNAVSCTIKEGKIPMKKVHALIALLVIAVVLPAGWQVLQGAPTEQLAQQIMHGDPSGVASGFLDALANNDLELAKELVVPEQQDRIDTWQRESRHRWVPCPNRNWLKDFSEMRFIFVSEWSSTGSLQFDDRAAVSAVTGCTFNQFEIQVNEAALHRDGYEWIILNWKEICIISTRGIKICYP
jgi:hypothetical protein